MRQLIDILILLSAVIAVNSPGSSLSLSFLSEGRIAEIRKYEKALGIVLLILGVYYFFSHLRWLWSDVLGFLLSICMILLGFYQAYDILLQLFEKNTFKLKSDQWYAWVGKYYPSFGLLAGILAVTDMIYWLF